MRFLSALCLALLLSGFAAAQATLMGGTASNWAPAYGVYLAPPVPLVTTPSVALVDSAPSPAGASSSAFGLVAGAANSTLSLPVQAGPSVYTEPVWYEPAASWYGTSTPATAPEAPAMHGSKQEHAFDFGVSSEGWNLAGRVPTAGQIAKAHRTYTNQDVEHVNDTNGTVKWDGKTEHI
jgi:hypothetical protein